MKRADLYPPLGVNGGPCRVVDRILSRHFPEKSEEVLVHEVETGHSLDNPSAARVYERPIRERTTTSPIVPYTIGPHAMYRMDLRLVTLKDLNAAISEYFATLSKLRARSDNDFQVELRKRLARGWVSSKGLFIQLAVHQGDPVVVTAYWDGVDDPSPPSGGCEHRVAGTQPLGDLSGYRTVVDEKPAKGIQDSSGDTIEHSPGESPKSDRSRALPQRTDTKENLGRHTPGNWGFNAPGPSEPGSTIKVRTPGTPGEEYGHPYKENVEPRRTEAGLFPPYSKRQKNQQGDAKRYYKRYYERNKGKAKLRAEKRYKKLRHSPSFLRVRDYRQNKKYEDRYHRLPANGYRENADRAKDNREEKKAGGAIGFFHPHFGYGKVLGVEDPNVIVALDDGAYEIDYLDFLNDVVFDGPEDIGQFFTLSDLSFESPSVSRVADTFYRETFKPGDNMDRAPGVQDMGEPSPYNPSLPYPDTDKNNVAPGHLLNDIREVDDNPGSAKVIPSGKGFVNKEASTLREIVRGVASSIRAGARSVRPSPGKATTEGYTFVIPGSEGTYNVRLSAQTPEGKGFSQSDFRVACECNFWRWQGPEHWAKVGGYLHGQPTGTASKPSQKDPKGVNRVCKHVFAVLNTVRKWGDDPPR